MSTLAAQLRQRKADKVPKEWLTIEQVAAKEGVCRETMLRQAPACIRAGLLELKHFRVLWGQTLRARPHYRYVKAK